MTSISNELLLHAQIPTPRATWEQIAQFALTFDGYRELGQQRLARLANAAPDGKLPTDLTHLRGVLFFERRRWRHYGEAPDRKAMRHIRAIVRRIRVARFVEQVEALARRRGFLRGADEG